MELRNLSWGQNHVKNFSQFQDSLRNAVRVSNPEKCLDSGLNGLSRWFLNVINEDPFPEIVLMKVKEPTVDRREPSRRFEADAPLSYRGQQTLTGRIIVI